MIRRIQRPPLGPLLLGLALLAPLGGCTGPNRGHWQGTFEGTVSGKMEFRISAWGSRLEGTLEGETRDGQPFQADLEGRLRGDDFYATFEGRSRLGALPVTFEGLMRGNLVGGKGEGDWTAELKASRGQMVGTWSAARSPER